MKNLGQMLKQAGEIQARMTELQEKLAQIEVTGSAGGGLVQVTLNGRAEARKVKVDPSLLVSDETEVLEDLLLAAFNDAKGKVEALIAERMAALTGGLKLPPGMVPPF